MKCNHCWIPWLDENMNHNIKTINYWRICVFCGILNFRNKIKEWNDIQAKKAGLI